MEDHPVLKEMIDHGSESKQEAAQCYTIYLDLCEVRGWWNVQIHYCKKLETAFISGHPTRHEPREIVLPLQSCQMVSLETIQTYLENIKLDDCSTNSITLAICDTDSSKVYYKISPGLVTPDSPETADKKKQGRILKFRNKRQKIAESLNSYLDSKKDEL